MKNKTKIYENLDFWIVSPYNKQYKLWVLIPLFSSLDLLSIIPLHLAFYSTSSSFYPPD